MSNEAQVNPLLTEAIITGTVDQRGLGVQPAKRTMEAVVEGGPIVPDVVVQMPEKKEE
jgi:hypothetical protein